MWTVSTRPPVLISGDGVLVGLMGDEGRAMSAPKGARFVASSWLEDDGDLADQERAAARASSAPPGGRSPDGPREQPRTKGAGAVGSKDWFNWMNGLTPVFYDEGRTKGGASGIRFDAYKTATTLQDYLRLHPDAGSPRDGQRPYKDFSNDFVKGLVKLLPSGALMTLDLRSQGAVLANNLGQEPDAIPLAAEALAVGLGYRIYHAATTIPSLKNLVVPESPEPWEQPWRHPEDDSDTWAPSGSSTSQEAEEGASHSGDPTRTVPDRLHETATALASIDSGLRAAQSFEALEPGRDSPPQVGGGPIDVYTAYGVTFARRGDFASGAESA
jgi:hypothetical protein